MSIAKHARIGLEHRSKSVMHRVLVSIFTGFIVFLLSNSWAAVNARSEADRVPEAETARFLAPDGTVNAQLGTSLDVDGDTLIMGAPASRDGGNVIRGAAYVFVRNGSNWALQAKLEPPAGAAINPQFGFNVGISGDTAVIGAQNDEIDGVRKGTAYVFVRSGATWTFQQKLQASDASPGSFFGSSVAIDGETIAIGSVNASVGAIRQGAAYVFIRSGSIWTEQSKLVDSDGNGNDQFGWAIDISGESVIVGGRFGDRDGIGGGVACIFTRTNSIWSRQARLAASDITAGDAFGSSVAIEGDTAVIGAPRKSVLASNSGGAAYIFGRTGNVWVQNQQLAYDSGPIYGEFGTSVAISGDRVIVGDPLITVQGRNAQGAAYLFIKTGGSWTVQNRLTASDGLVADHFATSVTIQGNRFFSGAPGVDVGPNGNQGAVYSFNQAPFAPDLQAASDTGVSNFDNITKLRNLTFDVQAITPGATIELLRDGTVVDSKVTVMPSAILTDPSTPPNGDFKYTSRQIVNGETSSPSEAITVTVDTFFPAVSIDQGANQQDPTRFGDNITFNAVFTELVAPLTAEDISLAGSTANTSNAGVTVGQTGIVQFEVVVNGIVSNGQVLTVSIPATAVTDLAGNASIQSTSTDNNVTVDNIRPTVTVEQASGQQDPTSLLPLNYTVVFSEPVTDFDRVDVNFNGSTANTGGAVASITGSGTEYNVSVTGVSSDGQLVRANVFSGVHDSVGNEIQLSTSIDNTILLDNVAPRVAIAQAVGQSDPTATQPVNFRVVFTENVTGFDASDVSLTDSTANISNALVTITGSGRDYNAAVSNITSSGQVKVNVPAGAAVDAFGHPSTASFANDNTVTLTVPASANITGQVTNSAGRGLGMVRIVINLGGETHYTMTNPSGYYRFIGAPTGAATVTVTRKNMAPSSRTFFLVQNTSGFDFVIDYSP